MRTLNPPLLWLVKVCKQQLWLERQARSAINVSGDTSVTISGTLSADVVKCKGVKLRMHWRKAWPMVLDTWVTTSLRSWSGYSHRTEVLTFEASKIGLEYRTPWHGM